jgi:glycosyltransferase involved in cell wall biosynthesis
VASSFGDRIIYLHRVVNGGEGAAKNSGVELATGDYVVILDADDTWMPQRLERIAEALCTEPCMDIVTTDATVVLDGKPVRSYYESVRWSNDQRRDILAGNFVFSHAAVRRSRWQSVGGMPEDRFCCADWPLWVKLIFTGSKVGLVPEQLVAYNIHADSLSASITTNLRTAVVAMSQLERLPGVSQEELAVAADLKRRAKLQIEHVLLMSSVYEGSPSRTALLGAALRGPYRPRGRVGMLARAIAPGMMRRHMREHPDIQHRI